MLKSAHLTFTKICRLCPSPYIPILLTTWVYLEGFMKPLPHSHIVYFPHRACPLLSFHAPQLFEWLVWHSPRPHLTASSPPPPPPLFLAFDTRFPTHPPLLAGRRFRRSLSFQRHVVKGKKVLQGRCAVMNFIETVRFIPPNPTCLGDTDSNCRLGDQKRVSYLIGPAGPCGWG